MGEIIEKAKETVFGMSAATIIALLIALFLVLFTTLLAIVSTIPPESQIARYSAFAILVLILFLGRFTDPWQWGFEFYNITIFTMALVFGMGTALAVTIITFFMLPIKWTIETPYDFYFNKDYIGPIIQTTVLFILSIAGGLLNVFAYESAVASLPYYFLAIFIPADMLVGNYLRLKITPLPIFRIAVYDLIVLIVNYNLATIAGQDILKLMLYLRG